jgi:hypothetical protein
MNRPAVDAIKRARQRIAVHGWRQGPRAKTFNGYSLHDGIVGKTGGKGTPAEQDAIRFVQEACEAIYPAKDAELDETKPYLEAWNDKPTRTKDQVLTVIAVAIGYAEKAKAPVDIKVNSEPNTPVPLPGPVAPPGPGPEAPAPEPIVSVTAPSPDLPALAAEAIALGYEVDDTWTEDRLRQAIAIAKRTDAKLAAMASAHAAQAPDPIEPMPTPLVLMSPGDRRAFFFNRRKT